MTISSPEFRSRLAMATPAGCRTVPDWKLVNTPSGNYVLTNIERRGQTRNLSSEYPEIVTKLGELMQEPKLEPVNLALKTDK